MFESRFETIKFDERIDKDLIDVYTVFNRFSSDLIGTTVYASNSPLQPKKKELLIT